MMRGFFACRFACSDRAAAAQVPDLSALLPEGEGSASGRVIQMIILLTVLSLAPGILIMVTSFIRFVIAFSFLRSGIGLQTTPGNLILISLGAVHDVLRHGADIRQGLGRRRPAADKQ
jgi:flagellar biosynthesis protein FliP